MVIFLMLSSSILSKRTFGIIYLCIILIFVHIILKYVINIFVVFCIVYTITDLYKKRKKYMWIIRIVIGNIKFISYTIVGESTINSILHIKPKQVRTRKKN